jgi:hypothetical protein
MAAILFPNRATEIEFRAEVDVTPAIEGGAGATKLGEAVAGRSGRLVLQYPFREADMDWIEAYTVGTGVEVLGELPADW